MIYRNRRLVLGVLVTVSIVVFSISFYFLTGQNDLTPNPSPTASPIATSSPTISPSSTHSPISTPTTTPSPSPSSSPFSFSFEEGLQGWAARGLDLDLANSTIDWDINTSQDLARGGSSSLEFYLENLNDKGKIWIEQSFEVEPNRLYHVDVSYTFASTDWGDMNWFRIITGVLTKSPSSREELVYQDYTGNGAGSDIGFLWLDKTYSFIIQSDSNGSLFVIIGIWGVWETPRTYYVDNVEVTFK